MEAKHDTHHPYPSFPAPAYRLHARSAARHWQPVGERRYPDDYPAVYGELTVTGVFDTYEESGYTYLQLIDAVMSF